MSMWEVVLLIVLAVLAGGLAQIISGFSVTGFIVSVIVGLTGALLGAWGADELGLPQFIKIGGLDFFVWPILGALVFLSIFGMLGPGRVREE